MTPPQQRSPAPFPPTVVTSWAGKTSILNALPREPALAGTLVIINEFGEIGLDPHASRPRASAAALVSHGGKKALCKLAQPD
ncbi:MAG TPA: hypothetical protein VHT48_02270 [Methylocella sp.]|nr:hypothetical protein [Methylocella sp.]